MTPHLSPLSKHIKTNLLKLYAQAFHPHKCCNWWNLIVNRVTQKGFEQEHWKGGSWAGDQLNRVWGLPVKRYELMIFLFLTTNHTMAPTWPALHYLLLAWYNDDCNQSYFNEDHGIAPQVHLAVCKECILSRLVGWEGNSHTHTHTDMYRVKT